MLFSNAQLAQLKTRFAEVGALSSTDSNLSELQAMLATTDDQLTGVAAALLVIQALLPQLTPAGAVLPFARATAPTGWLVCDGSAVSRTTYADLFDAIGTTFGVGDGSTTFALPDLRGEFIRGTDSGRGVDPGRDFGDAQEDALLAHEHRVPLVTAVRDNVGTAEYRHITNASPTAYVDTVTMTPAGNTETRPRNVNLLYCIKV